MLLRAKDYADESWVASSAVPYGHCLATSIPKRAAVSEFAGNDVALLQPEALQGNSPIGPIFNSLFNEMTTRIGL
jgi:hypothetical protein